MAKQTCAICGVQVGLIGQQKMADGTYICRKVCQKKAMKDFDFVGGSLPLLQEHLTQLEKDTETFKQLLFKKKPRIKFRNLGGLRVYEDLGLVVRVVTRNKYIVCGEYVEKACIYRIADLYAYEYEQGSKTAYDSQSKTHKVENTHHCHYYFWDTPGMSDFSVKIRNKADHKKIEAYYNRLFGIQKTLGNIGATWKNQINAIKAVGSAAKAAASGDENMEAKAGEAAAAMDRMQYGDRTTWKAKADAALAAFK